MNLPVDTQSLVVNSWNDMSQFGIQVLTGEACAFAMRLLCDVNEEGLDLMSDYWGLSSLDSQPAWNRMVNGQPSVGSIMVSRTELSALATYALFREGALATVELGNSITGLFSKDLLARYREHQVGTIRQNPKPHARIPHEGTRTVHVMSGRSV